MERLKRLRAAQLNKTFQNEVLTNAQKRAVEERDRVARLQIERAARAYSPPPRSPSPPRLQALPCWFSTNPPAGPSLLTQRGLLQRSHQNGCQGPRSSLRDQS